MNHPSTSPQKSAPRTWSFKLMGVCHRQTVKKRLTFHETLVGLLTGSLFHGWNEILPNWVVSHGFLRFPGPNQYNHPPPGTRHFSNKKTHTNSLRAKKFIVEIDFVDFWCKTSKKSKVNILKGKRLNPGRWVDWIAGSSGFHSCASLRISRRTLRLKKGRHKCDKMAWNNQLQAK